jgi:hypothetical protein
MQALYKIEGNEFKSALAQEGLTLSEGYEIKDLEEADFEAALNQHVRPMRNDLLKASDSRWIEKSSKAEDLTAINSYKQALRDLPDSLDLDSIDYLSEIEWPVEGE